MDEGLSDEAQPAMTMALGRKHLGAAQVLALSPQGPLTPIP